MYRTYDLQRILEVSMCIIRCVFTSTVCVTPQVKIQIGVFGGTQNMDTG